MRGTYEDLTGKRFGRRVVLARAERPNPSVRDNSTYWRVRCDCGVEDVLRSTTIKNTARCRACWAQKITGRDMTGERYGMLTVVERVRRSNGNKSARWCVRCDCGRVLVMNAENIRRSQGRGPKSCPDCVRRRPKVTRLVLEILLLAAEHAEVRGETVVEELGTTSQVAWSALRLGVKKGRLVRPSKGIYALAPLGLQILRDVAEGRRPDRWKLRGEIVAALDGSRASGRSTVRGRVAA